MATTKVTLEALHQLAQLLDNSANAILDAKSSMDSQLQGIIWDDPVGWNFRNKYEEQFRPLTEVLIPNIDRYIRHLRDLGVTLDQYTGSSLNPMIDGRRNPYFVPYGSEENVAEQVTPVASVAPQLAAADVTKTYITSDGYEVELVPIENGCGTEKGFGHLAGRTGASIDAYANSTGINPFVIVAAGPMAITGAAVAGRTIFHEEYERLNKDVCGLHDLGYHLQNDKAETDNALVEGGARLSGLAVKLSSQSDKAYIEAGVARQIHEQISNEMAQRGLRAPEGYIFRYK